MEFRLDESTHIYYLDDRQIDGLTDTIKEGGLIYEANDPRYMQDGEAVHKVTELYDRGVLEQYNVDERALPYLQSWKQFRKEHDYNPVHIEYKIYNPILMVGTKIDRLPGPVDIKTGQPAPWHILQIALQWETLIATDLLHMIGKPMDVYLDPEGGPPKLRRYSTVELMEAYKVYCSMLHFLRWKREKYGRIKINDHIAYRTSS